MTTDNNRYVTRAEFAAAIHSLEQRLRDPASSDLEKVQDIGFSTPSQLEPKYAPASPIAREAFKAGWHTNAVTEDAENKDHLRSAEDVDWCQFDRLGYNKYMDELRKQVDDDTRPWELDPVQTLPQYWKRKHRNGRVQYAIKQLHFNEKADGLDWVAKNYPSEFEEAKIGWSDTAPCFETNIWSEGLGQFTIELAQLEPKHVPLNATESKNLGMFLTTVIEALKPLVDIANAYDSNCLDEPARKHRGGETPMTNTTPLYHPDKIELYSGRGGRRLLTLGDCMRARETYAKLVGGAGA